MTAHIKGRMAKGAVWMVALRLSVTALGFASMVILARLLVPADFGLIALGTSMVAALELLTSFRFDVALIQNQSAKREDFDSAWTLNQLLGGALAVLLCLAAFPAAVFYHEPRLAPIVFVLAAGALLDGLQNIGIVNFRRDLEFAREFAFTFSRKLVQVIVAAVMAFWLRSYWALAAGILASSATGLLSSYAMHPYRPRWALSRACHLIRFSKWLMLDSAMYFLRNRSSDVMVGKLAGPAQLGLFGLAYELAAIANNNLSAPIDRAMFPGFARMAADREALKDAYLSVSGMTSLIAVPVAVGTAAVAPLLVPVVFGPRWLASVPVVEVLGIASAIGMLGARAQSVYLAIGRQRLVVWTSAMYVAVLLTGLALLLPGFGLVGAAWAFLIAASVNLPLQVGILNQVLGLPLVLWLRRVWRPALAAAAMHLSVTALQVRMPPAASALAGALQLLVVVAGGAACYAALVLGLWLAAGRPPGPERYLLDRLKVLKERPGPAPAAAVGLPQPPAISTGVVERSAQPAADSPDPGQGGERVSPRTILEAQLRHIWQEMLGTPEVGVTDDFFDLGGDSLLVNRMFHRVEQECRRRVVPSSLFPSVTIERLAAVLMAENRTHPVGRLTAIQTGDSPVPLFFLHGDHESGGFYCARLAQHLGRHQTFYAVHPHGLDGAELPATVEAMAADNVEALLQAQPNGRFVLGGFCNGGVIAFEMARQMHERGVPVESVLLIDARTDNARLRPLWRNIRLAGALLRLTPAQQRGLFRRLKIYGEEIAALPGPALVRWCRFLSRKLVRLFGDAGAVREAPVPPDADAAQADVDHPLWAAYHALLAVYVPGPYPGRVVLFTSRAMDERPPADMAKGWSIVAGEVIIHRIPGDHRECVTTFAAELARKMRPYLDGTPPAQSQLHAAALRSGAALAPAHTTSTSTTTG
jgi:O-antigen/teichoic acid export membrane protein/thioesterase domain-containing protein